MRLVTADFSGSFLTVCMAAAFLGSFCVVHAQGRLVDYQRAAKLRSLTQNKVFKARVTPHWFADNTRFWYRNDLPGGGREFILVDALAGRREPAFDHTRMATALGKAASKTLRGDHLPIEGLDFPGPANIVRLYAEEKTWQCDLRTYAVEERPELPPAISSLPAGQDPHPSTRTGPDTVVTFLNKTTREIKLIWIDPDGQRKPYGSVAPGGRYEQHTYSGHVWLVTDPEGKILGVYEAEDDPGVAIVDGMHPLPEKHPETGPVLQEGLSPDGKWVAFHKGHNVWLRDHAAGAEEALSTDGAAGDGYEGDLSWSPDSQRLVALKTKAGEDHKVYLVESSPKDQVQPKLHTISYLKPGDRIAITMPHLFDVVGRKQISVSDALFPNPWALEDVRWDQDSRRFTFFYNQRGHQVLRIIGIDATTGEAKAIVDEQSKTFIDYAGKSFTHYLDATHEILWMSERNGWNHLYLYDAQTGKVKNPVTHGEWVVRAVEKVDEEKRQVWFTASGVYPGQDPYYIHHGRVNLDGTGLTWLTEGDGTHSISFSPDRRFFIDTYSRVDDPPVNELRRTADGKLACALEKADASALLATGWKMPERFSAKGRDGKTDIFGVIIRPTNLDPDRKYPVVENIYAGPQSSYVPKGWSAFYEMQEIAELGFIVVQIDGMGTSNRSKAFHDVCWKNLADGGFPDRILWMKAAAEKYPTMDLSRVGIYGVSAGGQSALGALLFHPEFYKVGVADCGCHDNRMDKIWWNELWMGWPVGPEYAADSNVTNAHKLQGKLLLVVGEMDNNVDPSSTMQVVNALIKADKDFDLLVVPGSGHGATGSAYGQRRLRDFLVRNLLGVEPRSQD